MTLGEHLDPLSWDIAFWLQGAHDPDFPAGQLGAVANDLTAKLRAAAIIVLLAHGDSDTFYHNLIRSGRVRETYLRRMARAGRLDDHYIVSGRYGPLLDAVAAEQFDLGQRIAAASTTSWHPDGEYEDSYCWAQVLHRLVDEPARIDAVQEFLDRLERALDGVPSPRLGVGRALATPDQSLFEDSFDALLDEHEATIEAARQRGQQEDVGVLAERHVLIEGLALLRLAERRGLDTRSDYRFCPSLARVAMVRPFPSE